jgi:hypothetical protein
LADTTSTSSTIAAIASTASLTSVTSYGNNANHITITDNLVKGGYYGIRFNGSSTTVHCEDVVVTGNTLRKQYYYGTYFYYMDNFVVHDNDMRNYRNTTNVGVYGYYINEVNIQRNAHYGASYGIALGYLNLDYKPAVLSVVANNMCAASSSYGAYFPYVRYLNVYHNTFKGSSYGAYFSTSTGGSVAKVLDIRNNIFQGGTYAFYFSGNTMDSVTMDYNIYNSAGTNLAYYTAARATLAAWQTANPSLNANSSTNPVIFLAADDLHMQNAGANNAGTPISTVAVDIDGDVRSASTPDIGADEYVPVADDAKVLELIGASNACGDSATTISIVFENFGLSPITTMPATVQVTDAQGVMQSLTANYTGNLVPGSSDTLVVGSINTYLGGSFSYKGFTSLINDGRSNNDTITVNADFIPFMPIAITPDSVCADADSATFIATPLNGITYGWFASMTDTVPVVEADTAHLPISTQNTWYLGYVGSGVQKLTTTFAGGNSCGGGAMIDVVATKTINITGFEVNTTIAVGSSVPFSLYFIPNGNYLGNELNQSAWTLHGTVTGVSAGSGQPTVITLATPLIIPAGTTYALYLNYASSYTNGNGSNQVYSNPDMTINAGIGMCGLFTGANNPRVFNGSIVYGTVACTDTKVPVTVPILNPNVSAAFTATVQSNGATVDFDATGSAGSIYDWYFGDGNQSLNAGPIVQHTYGVGGTYVASLVVTEANCGVSDTLDQNVLANIGLSEFGINQGLQAFPNPNNGQFTVRISGAESFEGQLEVLNLMGQLVTATSVDKRSATLDVNLDLSDYAKGIYMLRLSGAEGQTVLRVVVR